MNYRRLGDAGVKLSEIGLGSWLTFGNVLSTEAAAAIVNKAFECGINFLDTADMYAEGRCEEVLGELLREKRRSDYVLATKVFFPMGPGPNDRGLSRKHVFEQCHCSLRRLGTEYIDLYQCHRFDEQTPVEETVRVMDDLVRQGKILYWGVSEWTGAQIEKCLKICSDRFERPKSNQPRYSLLERKGAEAVMPLCHRAGMGQVVFSPLAQGVLTGKYQPRQPIPPSSRAGDDRQNQFIKHWVDDKALLEKVQHLVGLAREQSCSLAQLALAWILRRPEVTSCIIGATRPQQVEENAEASGIKLEEETIRRMEELLV